jgi:hypothetical protein
MSSKENSTKPQPSKDVATKGQQTKGESPIVTKKFDELIDVPDFVTFLQYKAIAGEYHANTVLNEDQKAALVAEYGRWILAGKPKPSMPTLTGISVPVITSIYRIKTRGKQKIYAYISDGTKRGISEIAKHVRRVDPNTGKEFETNELTGEVDKHYTLDYTKELGEKLLGEALSTAEYPEKIGLYVFDGRQKLGPLNPEDFNLDFDELVNKYRPKK